jgi:hypothetical protein
MYIVYFIIINVTYLWAVKIEVWKVLHWTNSWHTFWLSQHTAITTLQIERQSMVIAMQQIPRESLAVINLRTARESITTLQIATESMKKTTQQRARESNGCNHATSLKSMGICSALRAFEQRGIFIMPHLLRHGTSIYTVSPERPEPTSHSGVHTPNSRFIRSLSPTL